VTRVERTNLPVAELTLVAGHDDLILGADLDATIIDVTDAKP